MFVNNHKCLVFISIRQFHLSTQSYILLTSSRICSSVRNKFGIVNKIPPMKISFFPRPNLTSGQKASYLQKWESKHTGMGSALGFYFTANGDCVFSPLCGI